jgi:hypothetical protein
MKESADLVPLEPRFFVVSTIATLALSCAEQRLLQAGLVISETAFALVRSAARSAFEELVGSAERIEELDYSLERLSRLWSVMTDRVAAEIDAPTLLIFNDWIASFRDYLASGTASGLSTKLLRLRADPTYQAGRLPPALRRTLCFKTAEMLVPIVARADIIPSDAFDRFVYSLWADAGKPANALDQYIALRAAEHLVSEIAAGIDHADQIQLARFASDGSAYT